MNVLYDSQIFSFQRFGGISLYFAKLIQYVPGLGTEALISSRNTVNYHICEVQSNMRSLNIKSKLSRAALSGYNLLSDAYAVTTRKYDILHSTYYLNTHAYLYEAVSRPHVITIHDMIPEVAPKYFRFNPHFKKRKFCELSDAIFCNSLATRNDLIRVYSLPPEKIFVIHHGVENGSRTQEKKIPVPPRYVLFVGKRDAYKNFTVVPQALQILRERVPDLELICVGGGPFSASERALLTDVGMAGQARQISATSGQLAFLYRNARCLIFPSFHEGFGLPVLEAMAEGCAPVISDIPCFREIADELAVFVDPGDPASVADGIAQAVAGEITREKFAERVRSFSWEETARKANAVYKNLV